MSRAALWLSAALLLPVALLLAACGGTSAAGDAPTDGRLMVVASTTQVADFTRNVAGDRARVVGLLKPNIDPHDYEPSPADVQALAHADLLVINGVGLEAGWLAPTVKAAGFAGTTVDTSTGVPVRGRDGAEEGGDPHIWHDPTNVKIMVADIAAALEAAAPADAAVLRAQAATYTAQLEALDADIRAKIDSVPVQDRKLVTNHDAFGYFVARYQLQFVGAIIPSFDSSAGLSGVDINDLVRKVKQTGAPAVFSESSLPEGTAQALARQAGVKVEAGEDSLFGDTLGPAGSPGDTYLRMEQHNINTIVSALRP